jgi:uncharacterized surface protein with fasciclin (FAS1) repeats
MRTGNLLAIAVLSTLLTAGFNQAAADSCGSKSEAHNQNKSMLTQASGIAEADTHKPVDIVETAASAGSFSTLVTAIKAAGLVKTLQGEGPFTVFAPTDEAFSKLPEGTIEALLKDRNRLTSVLTYHVVPGRVMSADVVKLKGAETVQGQNVKIRAGKDGVMVDDANVVSTDILASNGVIHVIDKVILPQ